jgi:hypothetical protein
VAAGEACAAGEGRAVKESDMSADQVPWVGIARRVLAGEFDGLMARSSHRGAIEIGLRAVDCDACRDALAHFKRLDKQNERRK